MKFSITISAEHCWRMVSAEVDGVPAGVIHMVGKRQGTYKISPLIISPEFRGKRGIGSLLLTHAEAYARENGSRQLYCTVAEKNRLALGFFLAKGFIVAGSSDSHYKVGVVETMLYKPLLTEQVVNALDQLNISVIPYEPRYREQVTQLMLCILPEQFGGIDQAWAEALYEGYERRHTADVNAKFKLIYVVVDRSHTVLGVAAATPKKGQPIKLMPFIAVNEAAFAALLSDLPYQLVPYGRKLYIHISPNPAEVTVLQRFGWSLDAALPNAYKIGQVTQQWSLHVGETTMRTLRVKKRFFDLIRSGKKTLEVRVGYSNIQNIRAGETILLATHDETFPVKAKDVRKYISFEEMSKKESMMRIAPDASSPEEVLQILQRIYPPEKERLGVVVLEF